MKAELFFKDVKLIENQANNGTEFLLCIYFVDK